MLDEKGGTAAPAAAPAPQAAPAAQPAPAAAPAPQQELPFDEEPRAEYPKRHIRHIPVIAPAPVEQEIIRKYSSSRPVLIMASDLALAKAYRAELSKHRIDSHIFISEKTRLKDSRTLDWADTAAVDKALQDFAAAHPDTQGLVYLLGCAEKKFAPASTDAYADFNRFTVPLFLAAKHLFKPLGAVEPGMSTFLAVVTRLDGGFGYRTDQVYDPIYGAIHGVALCLRKELEKTTVKLIDFAAGSPTEALVQKTFYELLYGDKRLAIGYDGARRSTMLAKPELLDYSRERTPLKGKKIIVTGGGRGLGSLFAKILARRWKPELILMDIIELGAGIERFAAMTEDQLKAYKNSELWAEVKKKHAKPTPALLEREFTALRDAAELYRTMQRIKAAGSRVSYLKCDLNDPEAFEAAVAGLKAEHGQVDGLVHFAGLERSKLVSDKALEEFQLIYKVKAHSAVNFLKSGLVKEKGFWVMISSIAGKFGNLGQSDYASASDYIAKMCVSLSNKGVRALSVDMTAYALIGMGARPGVEAFLKSQELDFLYPEEGMNAVADELAYGQRPEIVLSGSLGKLDWDKQLAFVPGFPGSSPSSWHFAEKVKASVKGVEFSAEKEYSLEKDPYLADHSINGTPYVPGVMGLETFAECAAEFSGRVPSSLEDVRFQVPIKLLRNKPVTGLINARPEGARTAMTISTEFTGPKGVKLGQARTHFSARASYETHKPWEGEEKPSIPKVKKYKVTAETIYKTYFHGPSFRVLEGILELEKDGTLAVFRRPQAPLFKGERPKLVFHPMVVEAAFQACGYRDIHFERKMTLPDSVGRVTVYPYENEPDILYLKTVYKGRDGEGRSVYDAFAFDEAHNLVAEVRDYLMIPTQI